jgi:hypothetical protein
LFLILASLFYLQGIVAFTYDDQIASRMEKQQATVTSDSKGVINEVLEVCNLFHVKPFEKMFLLIRTTPFYSAPHRLCFFQHSVNGFYVCYVVSLTYFVYRDSLVFFNLL